MGYCYFNEDGEILYNSETFGMTFLVDNNYDFCYCQTFIDNKPDRKQSGYVSEWTDFEGVNLQELFHIHRRLVTEKVYKLQVV